MKRVLYYLCFVLLFISCKKVITTEASLDKQVTLHFPIPYRSTYSTTFETLPDYSFLVDFNKGDYPGVDSLILVAGLRTEISSDTVYVRLFNVTDNNEIASSTMSASTGTEDYAVVKTRNIFGSLPDNKITLAVQFRSVAGSYVYVMEPRLILRRP